MKRQYQFALLSLSPIVVLSLLLILVGSAQAATTTVTTNVDAVSGDSECSLREAVQAANTNAAVDSCVAGSAGLDILTFNLPANSTITLINGQLTLSEPVFIDGSGAPNLIISGNNASKVFSFSAPASLLNLTVADGRANGSGGAIYSSTALTLTHVNVLSNTIVVGNAGGGLFAGGTLFIEGGRFENNRIGSSGALGGGLYAAGSLILSGTQFISNTAYYGGGLYAKTTLVMTGARFISNSVQISGGGAFVAGTTATVSDAYFENNRGNGKRGGGLNVESGTLILVNSQFINNMMLFEGGGVHALYAMISDTYFEHNQAQNGGGLEAGTAILTNTQFASNTAQLQGGGLYTRNGGALNQVSFSHNTADQGGGFHLGNGNLTQSGGIITLTSNTAITGGGVYIASGTLTLTHARLLSNTASMGGAVHQQGGTITVTQSCIVFNRDIALNYAAGVSPLTATGNWWGAANGPGGVGPGSGDLVSSNVNFSGFLTSPPANCPTHPFVDLTLSKNVTPLVIWPGQTLTYTLIVSNSGGLNATGVVISDTLPAELNFVGPVTIQGSPGSPGTPPTLASGLTIAAGRRITLTFPVTVNVDLAAGTIITNIAAVTSTEISRPALAVSVFSTSDNNSVYLPLLLKNIKRTKLQ
jgi:uncharacterized repeat protein (TIGR01451 family)/CSLREA domain-containing protein